MSLWLWNDPFCRPSMIPDQRFGTTLSPEDMIAPLIPREFRPLLQWPSNYFRPWRSSASSQDQGSTVSWEKDRFRANLDVQQFKPEEISVKVSEKDGTVTVEGQHEEKQDEHGYISRRFVRKYVLPQGHDLKKVESQLSSDGVLTITAPRSEVAEEMRSVPIVQTGQPSKAVEGKEPEKKQPEKKQPEKKEPEKKVQEKK